MNFIKLFTFLLIPCLLFSLVQNSFATNVKSESISIELGDTTIQIASYYKYKTDHPKIVFFNMHDNENTAVEAANNFINQNKGYLIEIKAQNERLITFILNGRNYIFDPNRIFTDMGINGTLKKYNKTYSEEAFQAVKEFALRLKNILIQTDPKIIVTIHNNTNGKYSIHTYLPGNALANDAKRIHLNKDKDPDNFFFVTISLFFDYFAEKGFNVILQDNEKVIDDGSLSIYCTQQKIPYINIDVEHGYSEQQFEMIKEVDKLGKNLFK